MKNLLVFSKEKLIRKRNSKDNNSNLRPNPYLGSAL